jgi:hypothetical protein
VEAKERGAQDFFVMYYMVIMVAITAIVTVT